MGVDLKPCPFCGLPPVAHPSGDGSGVMIECLTPDCVNPHVSYYGKGFAAAIWNRRAAPAEECQPPISGGASARGRVHEAEESAVYPIPEGWALVPREPTEEMKLAAFGPIRDGGRHGPVTSDMVRQQAALSVYRAMIAAAPTEARSVEAPSAWEWLAEHVNLELDWGEIDEGEAAWRVHRVSGGRNDREWELIATGDTPELAVLAARAVLPAPPKAEAE